ncbi:hypothetical protein VHEMI06775 [[Torrubiella] hemipterigena]|uniref:Uncharacterized protein n=1 Tax=[Torrubiella] hemipterigena TaxID=1531966 RepID=A0A0A1T8B9_9HYPO|nr:hypothetical protein VHEMI06775 [[Torrubiella] hemipterigena]
MSASTLTLEQLELGILPALGRELWSWPECVCTIGRSCNQDECTARVKRLTRYFQFYKGIVQVYIGESFPSTRVFQTHGGLFAAIQMLKHCPYMTRSEFARAITRHNTSEKALSDAIALVVQTLTMVDCSPVYYSSDVLEQGNASWTPWKDEVRFNEYISDLFPKKPHSILSVPNSDLYNGFTNALRARKLQKHLGIAMRPTRDLRNHLRFDRKNRVLYIFHHAAFLKEQLKLIKENFSEPVAVALPPRRLLLETLTSLQEILFPLSDPRSRALLDTLVTTNSFDPDISVYVYDSIRVEFEDSQVMSYVYLTDRLADLYAELQNPSPSGWLERALERKSSGRYVMMATLGGVVFAVVLGLLSLIVSIYQTWLTYQAWKHPATP